ncbi:hypothetical protein PSYPI_49042, partial [Pseudomonas syringae pv. pisi str. 1704B]
GDLRPHKQYVLSLTDAVLNGESAHALRMLEGLRG